MEIALVAAAAVLGLLLGSFANVVIHRVPEGASVVRPPSACPGCGTEIAPRDNIPVLSWLLLRGRCRHCREPISARYPVVEALCAALFALVAWRVGMSALLPAFLAFAWLLLVLSVIDARTRRIPNAITYPAAPVLLVLVVAGALVEGDGWAALRSPLGGLAAFAGLLIIALISPRGMGMGDVKLAGLMGLVLGALGWGHILLGVFGGFLVGGVTAIALLVLRVRQRRDLIPFGPYLAAGGLASLLFGEPLIDAYLRSVGLA